MIFLYSGTPGSFKSYHAVAESLDWLRMGRNLITNFPLDYKKKIRKPIKGDYQFFQRTLSFLPIWRVVVSLMPFRRQIFLTVVWYLTAIFERVSPDLTVWYFIAA